MIMSRSRSAAARAAGVVAALPLAFGLLVAGAPAAGAAVTAPGDGTVFSSYSTFEIRASYPGSTTDSRLTLTSPGGPAVTVATASGGLNGGTMTYRLDTGCWIHPSDDCSSRFGKRLAPNGTWTITQSGAASSSSTFVTRIRPAAPTAVTATGLNPREVRVSWRLGEEPDLTGWAVLEGSTVVKDGIGRSACEGSTCSTVITYATEGTGEHTYAVRAFRSVAPGSSSTLESPLSSTASARLDAPAPAPAESPAGGSTSGGSTGGSDSGSGDGSTDGGSSDGGSTDGGSSDGGSTDGSGGGSTDGGSTGGSTSGGSTSGGSTSGGSTSGGSTSGGSTGGSSGASKAPIKTGTTSAGASADSQAIAQRKAFALTFSAFGPKLGIPKLPPLPQAQSPAIAPELADGTYEPTLGFEEQEFTERVEVAAPQNPTERVRNVVGSALDSERLVRSTAAALVLLLAGAHLRRWLGAPTED